MIGLRTLSSDHSHALPRPLLWNDFYQHLQLLVSKSSALRCSKETTLELFAQLISAACKHQWQSKTSLQNQFHAVVSPGCFVPSSVQCHDASYSSMWLPIDLFLEDAMEGIVVSPTCAIDSLTGMLSEWCIRMWYDYSHVKGENSCTYCRHGEVT